MHDIISDKDRDVLRKLSQQIRNYADSDVNKERIAAWTALNDLKAYRPVLMISPEGSWREILPTFPRECAGEFAIQIEQTLRQRLYQFEVIQDDSVISPYFHIGRYVKSSGYGVEINTQVSDTVNGSFKYIPPISDLSTDLDKLRQPEYSADFAAATRDYEIMDYILGDILPLRYQAFDWWTNGLTATAISLIGLENLFLAMYTNPDELKALMSFLAEDALRHLDFWESQHLLCSNNQGYIGSGGEGYNSFLPELPDGNVTASQMWGFAESQETVGCSPEMFAEFIFPYQEQVMKRYGLIYYGCCEPVEKRFDTIKQLKQLRVISVSPWSDMETCAELYKRDYVFCRKPNPADVCVGFHEKQIIEDLTRTKAIAGDLNLSVILKDTHTLENKPEKLQKYVALARKILF